jgi:hypothetical protein
VLPAWFHYTDYIYHCCGNVYADRYRTNSPIVCVVLDHTNMRPFLFRFVNSTLQLWCHITVKYLNFSLCNIPPKHDLKHLWGCCLLWFGEAQVTTCIMQSLRWNPWCYWSGIDCNDRATVVEVGWRRCCLEDCWECCSSLELARLGMLFSEARWSQRVSWSGWSH